MHVKQAYKILDIITKLASYKVTFIKFIFDVWENKIMHQSL